LLGDGRGALVVVRSAVIPVLAVAAIEMVIAATSSEDVVAVSDRRQALP
jgi:hypothetical protein